MSEYQYYEFQTVDRSLTSVQMRELRAISSRADITAKTFTNTYDFGSFSGDARKMMEAYYDAHVYVSNFGTVVFMLRLPRTVLPDNVLNEYAIEYGLDWWTTDEHTILEWKRIDDESSGEWMEGEGWMGRLLPIRDELVRGDYRSLYLAWLSSIVYGSPEDDAEEKYEDEEDDEYPDDSEEDDTDAPDDSEDEEDPEEEDDYVPNKRRKEPPIPAGLGALTTAQSALVEFISVDSDLITAAAGASPEVSANANSAEKMAEWVAQMPEQEVRSIVRRILEGEGLWVQTELQSRYYRSGSSAQAKAGGSRRTAAELLTLAAQAEIARKQREKEERERKQKENDRKRQAYLVGLVPRFADLWAKVNALVEEQKATPYDQACTLLVDLHAAYSQAGRRPEFDAEFAKFLGKYSRSTALVRRFKEAKLMP